MMPYLLVTLTIRRHLLIRDGCYWIGRRDEG